MPHEYPDRCEVQQHERERYCQKDAGHDDTRIDRRGELAQVPEPEIDEGRLLGIEPRRLTRSLTAAAETTEPPGSGMRPIAAGAMWIASLGPMPSSASANRVSIPRCSMRRLMVSAQMTMASSRNVCTSVIARSISRGVSAGDRVSSDSSTLPVKMVGPGGTFS
jgi:hypothetical protein